jgi:hypothetical protein
MSAITPITLRPDKRRGDSYRRAFPGLHFETFMGARVTYSYRGDRGWMFRTAFGCGAFERLEAAKGEARVMIFEGLAEAAQQPAIAQVIAALVQAA